MFRIGLVIIITFFSISAFSQKEETGEFSAIRTNNGVLFIYNNKESSFMFEAPAKSMKEIDRDQMMFILDNMVIQFTPIPVNFFYLEANRNTPDSIVLLTHQQEELITLESQFNKVINTENEFFRVKSNNFNNDSRLFYLWGFPHPNLSEDKSDYNVIHHYYCTTRYNDFVLMISSAVMQMNDTSEVKSFLRNIASSVRTSNIPFNIEFIRDSVIKIQK